MVPFAILSGELKTKSEKLEIRVLDLAVDAFSFRLAKKERLASDKIQITLHFFVFAEKQYEKVVLKQPVVTRIEETEYYDVYRAETDSEEFARYARVLMKEYLGYVRMKNEYSDAQISEKMVHYPADKEAVYTEDFVSQKRAWFQKCVEETEWEPKDLESLELGICLDNEERYQQFLQHTFPQFVENFWKQEGLCGHPITQMKVTHIYIGNKYCPLLFPEQERLEQILQRIEEEHLKPVIVFSYLQEDEIKYCKHLLAWLAEWAREREPIEVVVNDWGMLSIIRRKRYKCFKITLGVLLQKRTKDVRMEYRACTVKDSSGKWQDYDYRRYLEEYFSVERYVLESAENQCAILPNQTELHLPFFQMNTSQYCTLYARCHNGGRGNQCEVKICPEYCKEKVFLYPSMLHMIGRYNSLLGYDRTILISRKRLEQCINQGIDRIVVNVL